MNLSPHFTFEELTKTDHPEFADMNAAAGKLYMPEAMQLTGLLEQVRELIGVPMIISSAFRCPQLNKAIGGVSNSQHCLFEAADTTYKGVSLKDAYNKIMASSIPFGQLIFEFGSWVHISVQDPERYPLAVCTCLQIETVGGYEKVLEPLV